MKEHSKSTTHVWPLNLELKFFNCRRKKSETVTTWIVFHLNLYLFGRVCVCVCMKRMDRSLWCAHVRIEHQLVHMALFVWLGVRNPREKQNRRFWCVYARVRMTDRARKKAYIEAQTEKQLNSMKLYTRCVHARETLVLSYFSRFSPSFALFSSSTRVSTFRTSHYAMRCDAIVLSFCATVNSYEHF